MKNVKILTILFLAGLMFCSAEVGQGAPMGKAFTYQGHLYDTNNVANGEYDLQFKLFDDPCEGTQEGNTIDMNSLDVIDGYFTAALDFNDVNAFNGYARWLEIAVRPGESDDPNGYTVLEPRQEITPVPYASYASSSGSGSGSDNDWAWSSGSGLTGDIYHTGDVGIGTTTPDNKLEVVGSVAGSGALRVENTSGSTGSHGIIADGGGGLNSWGVYGTAMGGVCGLGTGWHGVYGISNSSFTGHAGVCGYNTEGGWAGYFTGKGYFSDNVGIGTDSPARALHVSDVMRLQPRTTTPSAPWAEGDIYMNSTTHKLMVYDGSTWRACW